MLSDKEILGILNSELTQSLGWDTDELTANRKAAWDYFYNRARGDEIEGRSHVQSSDVSDMVEAVLSNLAPILTNETLIQFEAAGEEDEEQARLESDFVAYMVGGQNKGFVQILSAIKDALLLKNGFIKVWVDKVDDTIRYTKAGISEFQIEAELSRSGNDRTITVSNTDDNADGTFDVSFSEYIHTRELVVEAIPPEDLKYSPDMRSQFISDARFSAERKLLTRSELLAMGYPKTQVDELGAYQTDTSEEARARKEDSNDPAQTTDKSQEIIETWDIHALIDEEEDGRSLLRHYHITVGEILLNETVQWIPLATGSPFIVPHRLYGQSIYDKLKQTQDTKTHGLRQWNDNMRRVNNARLAYNPNVTTEADVLDSRPGGGVRSKNPAEIVQIATNDMGQSIQAALDYADKQRGERAGASLDLQSSQMQLAGQVGNVGAERQISVREQLAALMTMTLANTLLRETFLLVHRTLRAFVPGEMSAKLHGKWVKTDPSKWPERTHLNVSTGLSTGEKQRRSSALNQVIQAQSGFMQSGLDGILTDPGGMHNAILDWSRANGLENPEQYWTDPASPEAQAAGQAKQQQAQQQAAAEKAAADQQYEWARNMHTLEQLIEKYKADIENQYKYDSDVLDAEIEEAKILGEATLDLERAENDFKTKSNDAETKAAATDQAMNQ